MPELPEVETIRQDLVNFVIHKKIRKMTIRDRKVIKNNKNVFRKLVNEDFDSISRIGKLLIFEINKDLFLLVHLKMTGQLVYCSGDRCVAGGHSLSSEEKIPGIGDKLPNKYTRVMIEFNDQSTLYFNDLRKFGYLRIVNSEELNIIKETFGIEPLTKNFTLENFRKVFKNRKTNIKALLLNQKLIAGIGNIYADEILFEAQIKPSRKAKSLTQKEIETIFNSTQIIIKSAIKYRGTTFNNYIDSQGKTGNFSKLLKVYGRQGKKCIRCKKSVITKEKLAQRGTSYCKNCQK